MLKNSYPLNQILITDQFLLLSPSFFLFIGVAGIRVLNTLSKILIPASSYWVSDTLTYFWLVVTTILLIGISLYLRKDMISSQPRQIEFFRSYMFFSCFFTFLVCYIADISWIFLQLYDHQEYGNTFSYSFVLYLRQECWLYLYLILLIYITAKLTQIKNTSNNIGVVWFKKIFRIVLSLTSLTFLIIPTFLNFLLFYHSHSDEYEGISLSLEWLCNTIYFILTLSILFFCWRQKKVYDLSLDTFVSIFKKIGTEALLGFIVQLLGIILPLFMDMTSTWKMFPFSFQPELIALTPIVLVIFICMVGFHYSKKQIYLPNEKSASYSSTTGNFGNAMWADTDNLLKRNCYNPSRGPIIGQDRQDQLLHLKLSNKLILGPPGSGKTSASSIPVLLSENRPMFVFDIKGELWATTARFRHEVLGREVIYIDPYRVIKDSDFSKSKPSSLLFDYRFNPFDWIPEDEYLRDRMINAFASSFIISDCTTAQSGGNARHFDENARILIRGYIDFMMKTLPKAERTLATLFHLLSQDKQTAQMTFENMALVSGRAAAAANQISRVGEQERGSILSTSYRQIDWMSDKNLQYTLAESNFNLRDFLKGNMDIFVILPTEQVQEQSRLVRMLLALLKALITQANPRELPSRKMLFLLDELAQLGYCPDVEQFIEVMRSRGVVVWTVFQTLSQIQQYQKPDLFLSAPIKQIFTLDDKNTMQWIQTLGGKKTIKNKNISKNESDSRNKFQFIGGSVSHSESESIQETGVDLIQLNEIRELSFSEQFIFEHGEKPIRCRKVFYFEHPFFTDKYDANPLETTKY